MAIRVLRRAVVLRDSASVRFKNDGAEAITPNDARAIPPDLMKYLLFIKNLVNRKSRREILFTSHDLLIPNLLSLKFRRAENQSCQLHHRIINVRRVQSRELLLWRLLLLRTTQTRPEISALKSFFEWICRSGVRCNLRARR